MSDKVELPEKAIRWLIPGFRPRPRRNIWQWASEQVDYSRASSYDTPIKAKYDPDYMPYWKEPVECLTSYDVREVVVLKCARSGGTENLLLNTIRYCIARSPQPVLYVTGDQLSAERMMEKRIKRSMRCSKETQSQYAHARATEHEIDFPAMDLRVTWAKAKQAFKQDGWALVLCDEVSTWPEYAADMARRRTASYPFAHIAIISSPDPASKRPSSEDPIFVEYERGDKRQWYCPDPGGGEFVFRMGSKDGDGLRWDKSAKREDGTWDLAIVEQTAHYVTPSGAIIREPERMQIVRAGRWIPSVAASGATRSYHVTAFMSPFETLGKIAVAFLQAHAGGPHALRAFVYEYLAEAWYGEKIEIESAAIDQRRSAYPMKTVPHATPALAYLARANRPSSIMTVDVQKDRLYYVVRCWYDGGDSALIDFGEALEWRDLAAIAARWSCAKSFVDAGYADRRLELYEQATVGDLVGAIVTFGRDSLRDSIAPIRRIDPFEGTARAGRHKIISLTFNPDHIKNSLSRLISGEDSHQWHIPSDVPELYRRHMTSEQCIDGAWVKKTKENHGWDCEVMQLVAAIALGIYRMTGLIKEESQAAGAANQQQQTQTKQRRAGVYYD